MILAEPPKVYNSLTRSMEPIAADSPIGLYVCGITPYDAMHLGHAFTYTFFDVLVRYLRFLGHEVTYVQNITDIDNDVLRKAGELGRDWKELGDSEVLKFQDINRRLDNRPPDVNPRATEHMAEMWAITGDLLSKGLAYESSGSIYFEVGKAARFGQLFPAPYEEKLRVANQNGNFADDPRKRDPLDFVLWQAWKEGEPSWESPWGPGRPGWHIECSAMSMKYLGQTLTLHGGGRDLIFPHHDCETLQSESYTSQTFVKHWIHTGMVRLDGEKMSKSLGNMVFAADLLDRYPADALRLYLIARDHREDWDYDQAALEKWVSLAGLLSARLSDIEEMPEAEAIEVMHQPVFEALQDGFDVASAAHQLIEISASNGDPARLRAAKTFATRVFGLTLQTNLST